MVFKKVIQIFILSAAVLFLAEARSAPICSSIFADHAAIFKFSEAANKVEGVNPWTSREFWKELETLSSSDVNQLLVNLYGARFKAIANYSLRIPEKFQVLLLEPGIANRLPELSRFLAKKDLAIEGLSPFKARELFSKSLGVSTVYRAITVPEQMKGSDQNLLASSFVNAPTHAMRETLLSFYAGNEATSLSKTVFLKLEGSSTGNTPLVSITAYPELAAAVGWGSRRPHNMENPIVLVYKLLIPEIQVIRKHRLFPMSKGERESNIEVISSPRDVWEEYSFGDLGVEGLILFGVDKKWVQSVSIEAQPAVYHID